MSGGRPGRAGPGRAARQEPRPFSGHDRAEDRAVHDPLYGLHDDGGQPPPSFDLRQVRRVAPGPRSSAGARHSAAATASWMARLIPTPPAGDIACAASPMQSRPLMCQRRSRSRRTSSQCRSSSERDGVNPVRKVRAERRDPPSEALDALRTDPGVGALRARGSPSGSSRCGTAPPAPRRGRTPGRCPATSPCFGGIARAAGTTRCRRAPGNSFGASPAARRSAEWRPSVATTRSARSRSCAPSAVR